MSTSIAHTPRRVLAGLLAVALALTGVVLSAAVADAATSQRLAGEDRFETSVEVSMAAFDETTSDVIVALGGNVDGEPAFADALAASGVAGYVDAPILLTDISDVPDVVIAELERLDPDTVHIAGGTAAVDASAQAEIEAAVPDAAINRFAGEVREDTARLMAEAIGEANVGELNGLPTAIIARADNFPDALAGGPIAYAGVHPILLTQTDEVPEETTSALDTLGIEQVVILGGPNAVSEDVEETLEADVGTDAIRLAGENREETAIEIAMTAVDSFGWDLDEILLARSDQPSDALSGGPYGGENQAPILLTQTDSLNASTAEYLANAPEDAQLTVLGGPAAIADSTVEAAIAAIEGDAPPTNQTFTVTPQDAVTLTVATPDDTSDDRVYTVENAVVDAEHQIVLVDADDVSVDDDGIVTFLDDTPDDNEADLNLAAADITVVNGAPIAGADADASVTPTSESFTFRVDGDSDETIVPVVYADADEEGDLDLDMDDLPSEPFGIGGAINYNPAEAATGTTAGATAVTEVDTEGDNFIAGNSYFYDANDTFTIDGTPGNIAAFEAALQVNDQVAVTGYQQNSDLVSEFDLTNTVPAAPNSSAPTVAGQNTVTFTFDNIVDDATVTVYYTEDGTPGTPGTPALDTDTFDSVESTEDGDADAAGYQVAVTGLDSATDYEFYAVQEDASGESPAYNEEAMTAVDAVPTATDAIANDINDGVGTTNEILVTFSEAVTVNDASGITLDVSGFTIDGVSAEVDNEASTRYVITLDQTLNDAPTGSEPTYSANIAADTVTDSTGNENVAATGFDTFQY